MTSQRKPYRDVPSDDDDDDDVEEPDGLFREDDDDDGDDGGENGDDGGMPSAAVAAARRNKRRTTRRGGGRRGRGGNSRYSSLDNEEYYDDENDPFGREIWNDEVQDDDNDDNDPIGRMRQRRHLRQQRRIARQNSCLTCIWCVTMALMLTGSIALIGWRYQQKTGHLPGNLTAADVEDWFRQDDDDGLEEDEENGDVSSSSSSKPNKEKKPHGHIVHYDPNAGLASNNVNPFDLSPEQTSFQLPPFPNYETETQDTDATSLDNNLGFYMQPDIVGNQLVFVTEGDLYWTILPPQEDLSTTTTTSSLPAIKLTSTIGNVRTPKINPTYPYLVAFTATYTGHREIYVMDLRPTHRSRPPTRLTYTTSGIRRVVEWHDEGQSLLFAARNQDVTGGLPDVRLYSIAISIPSSDSSSFIRPLQITPIPLAQAIDGTYDRHDDGDDAEHDCLYFTRFGQSSETKRYVGGTTESIWVWCKDQTSAKPLWGSKGGQDSYNGTVKSPTWFINNNNNEQDQDDEYMFVLSDRFLNKDDDDKWIPGNMELFVIQLPHGDIYQEELPMNFISLTSAYCDFNGMGIQEYSISPSTTTTTSDDDDDGGRLILRVGADLYTAKFQDLLLTMMNNKDGSSNNNVWIKVPLVIYSDFNQHQERIRSVSYPTDLTSLDVYDTSFDTTHLLLGVRGQVWTCPIVDDLDVLLQQQPLSFAGGSGMNLPQRRMRIVPGITMGGLVRVQTALHVPLWQEIYKTSRRLSLILATDPSSPTGEHAFYLLETQHDAIPSFVSTPELPIPFVGGNSINGGGGPTNMGGLGSIKVDTVTVSPCGRRFAWSDTDGRIVVMTIPLYLKKQSNYIVLPSTNDNGQPMMGDEVDLSWSPGGRYLAITHSAKNQFTIISIADCGPFVNNEEDDDDNNNNDDDDNNNNNNDDDDDDDDTPPTFNDIQIGRIVQATSHRFNSFDAIWGTTTLDIALQGILPSLGTMMLNDENENENAPPEGSATTLYYLSDRDVQSDVKSPWGTRAPAPHFPKYYSVYALPLIVRQQKSNHHHDNNENDDLITKVGHGAIYGGGGVSELWANHMLELSETLDELLLPSDEDDDNDDASSSRRRRQRQRRSLLTAAASAIGTSSRQQQQRRHRRRLADLEEDDPNNGGQQGDDDESGVFIQPEDPPPDVVEEAAPSMAPSSLLEGSSVSNQPSSFGQEGTTTTTSPQPSSMEQQEQDSSSSSSSFITPAPASSTTTTTTTSSLLTPAPASSSSTSSSLITPAPASSSSSLLTPAPASTSSSSSSLQTPRPIASAQPTPEPTEGKTPMPTPVPSGAPTTTTSNNMTAKAKVSIFPEDCIITAFGEGNLMEHSYRVAGIPTDKYASLLAQTMDDSTFLLVKNLEDGTLRPVVVAAEPHPSDVMEAIMVLEEYELQAFSVSTTREYVVMVFAPGYIKVVPLTGQGLVSLVTEKKLTKSLADANDIALSIYPSLEYEQMYHDAWRLLRDYFYDTDMHGINWRMMHDRYKDLVKRCSKREELDDVLAQMASELSALHVFVYGGEYPDPLDREEAYMYEMAGLGATLVPSPEWHGYRITGIAETDPDFHDVDGKAVYSPLSDDVLRLTGQRGLAVGDVIVAVNGESVMRVPDFHLLLRGLSGQSIRLDVLRLKSSTSSGTTTTTTTSSSSEQGEQRRRLEDGNTTNDSDDDNDDDTKKKRTEPVITVPLTQKDISRLQYQAWEYKRRLIAEKLAADKGFTVGYLHLSSMGQDDMNAFVRGFYPNYDKEALIVDVRHNAGGSIDSWLLDILQRRAWMYWQGRVTNTQNGGLGWDEQFAFRGHLVVLMDEKTSSDGEGFSRGVSELGLGKLIGMRTWGGGIWLSSDNTLVDSGVATAPEIGTYNDKYGWGLGIEQHGVEPDIVVDNDPHETYNGRDAQLERAIDVLANWLEEEPYVIPTPPTPQKPKKAMNELVKNQCKAAA